MRVFKMASIVAIAQQLLDRAKELEAYMASRGLDSPSLEKDVFADLPTEQAAIRMAITENTRALQQLVAGPVVTAMDIFHSVRFRPPGNRQEMGS